MRGSRLFWLTLFKTQNKAGFTQAHFSKLKTRPVSHKHTFQDTKQDRFYTGTLFKTQNKPVLVVSIGFFSQIVRFHTMEYISSN